MQYVQNLSHPYMMFTHALCLPKRLTGKSSITSPSAENTSIVFSFCIACARSIGNRWILCVPKISLTCGYFANKSCTISSSCAIQPHSPITKSGFSLYSRFNAPNSPNTLSSAFLRIAHVFKIITSALSSEAVATKPSVSIIPAIVSPSRSFA